MRFIIKLAIEDENSAETVEEIMCLNKRYGPDSSKKVSNPLTD